MTNAIKDRARGVLGGTAADKVQGDQPGAMKAFAAAAVAGTATGAVVFKLLRH
jgi:outer membrane lipoprotein SlyB